jgi:hypothetical protein
MGHGIALGTVMTSAVLITCDGGSHQNGLARLIAYVVVAKAAGIALGVREVDATPGRDWIR